MTHVSMIDLPEAARRLGLTWRGCYDLLLSGMLRGEKCRGRWQVNAADVEKLRAEREAAAAGEDR